ncbi:MAG: polysaccharide pyruvyl transferase family protein [Nitrospira sp.]|nr:polysaccharide pyruvyl transferase family protein [Nitrospira sp.]
MQTIKQANVLRSPGARRIGVVAIQRYWSDPSSLDFDRLYLAVGRNTGNLMFTEAIFRLIEADFHNVGFSFEPDWVNVHCDCLVIPAANWLNEYSEWDWFTERLHQLKIPAIVIGLGLQAASSDISHVKVNDSCRRLLDFFASQPIPISVRGNFTRDWLRSLGIEHTVTTGCPSLYMNIFNNDHSSCGQGLIFQSTRYGLSPSFLGSDSINRRMFDFMVDFDMPMIYQSEPEEMFLLTVQASASTLGQPKAQLLMDLYKCHTVPELDARLTKNGKVFYDLMAWSEFVQAHWGVLGTRLHGAILALNSGRPAILVPHDSRTAEMASFAGIPARLGPVVRDCQTIDEIKALFSPDDLVRYRDIRSRNQAIFIHFLRDCGLVPNTSAMF